MMRVFWAVLLRDLRLGLRAGAGFGLGLMFFASVVSVMPFALGPDLALLSRLGPAILWISALLALLLGLDRVFQNDFEDGALDALLAAPCPFEVVALAKAVAHWLTSALPLVCAAPLLGLLLDMEPETLVRTSASLLIGTPALTLLGVLGAALTVGLKRGGVLIPVLMLPLAVPVLIFGVAASAGGSAPLLFLASFSLMSLAMVPFAVAAVLRGSPG